MYITFFHPWLRVSKYCSQMLLQHPMVIAYVFLQQKNTSHVRVAAEWPFVKAPFSFSLPWFCLHPFLQVPHARKHASSLTSCQNPSMPCSLAGPSLTYPYCIFPTQSEGFGCYLPSMAYKAAREACSSNDEACSSNDRGIGSLTSVGCQILFKVEARIHFCILASFTLLLPKR